MASANSFAAVSGDGPLSVGRAAPLDDMSFSVLASASLFEAFTLLIVSAGL